MRKDELKLYVEQLWDEGRRCYDDLKDAELDILTALIMQQSRHQWDFIVETPYEDKLPRELISYLLERSHDNAIEAMGTLVAGARLAAEHEINDLFQRRAELEAYYNPNREPTETELMIAEYHREVARDIRRVANA